MRWKIWVITGWGIWPITPMSKRGWEGFRRFVLKYCPGTGWRN